MEQRKLIKLGNSSFAIALPKNWIDKSGLKKGDDIFIEHNPNGEIIVSSKIMKKNGNANVVLNMAGFDKPMIKKEMRAAYIKGYDSFVIKSASNKNEVKKVLSELLGFEVVETRGDEIIAKDFFNLEDTKIENFITRINNNLNEMFNLIIEAVKNDKISPKLVRDIENIDTDINKLHLLISRIFFIGINNPAVLNTLKTTPAQLFSQWHISFNLEIAGDRLKTVARMAETDKKDVQKILPLLEITKESYDTLIKAFGKNNKESALDYLNQSRNFLDRIDETSKKTGADLNMVNEIKAIENSFYQNVKTVLNMVF